MTIERQIRTMITHADPARETTIPPAVTTATQVIARADAAAAATGTHRPALVRRRLVLVGGAAMAAAAVTAYALPRRATTDRDATRLPDLSPTGQVIVPIGYEFDSDPQRRRHNCAPSPRRSSTRPTTRGPVGTRTATGSPGPPRP